MINRMQHALWILAVLLLVSVFPSRANAAFAFVAHRGDMLDVPEETEMAILKAKENGYRWIELDVRETSDHSFIIFHDSNLKRLCGVNINAMKLNAKPNSPYYYRKKIVNIDIGKPWKGKAQYIISLDKALKMCKDNNLSLYLHIKFIHASDRKCVKKFFDKIEKYGMKKKVVILNISKPYLVKMRKHQEQLKYKGFQWAFLCQSLSQADRLETFKVANKNKCNTIIFNYGSATNGEGAMASNALMAACHRAGMKVVAYPIRGNYVLEKAKKDVAALRKRGYDHIICNMKCW